MSSSKKIRVISLGLIINGDRTLLGEGHDSVKQDKYYRALGGGVDFGETSIDALKREFQEETKAELKNIKYLGCLENIFICNGKPGHEIIQLYQCDFADSKFYQLEAIEVTEGKRKKQAVWLDIKQCKSGEIRVVPEQFLNYL